MIILFSFIIPMILSIGTSRAVFTEFHINLFILLVVQLELFILIAGEISHFHICERNVFLNDNQGKDNDVDYSLEQLQSMLDPRKFFRINRECIINIDAIALMHNYSSSRLQLDLKNKEKSDLFIVSRDKVAEFKRWIDR
jgi:DNA-binding LytR/AlgR family response regulator